MTDINSYLNFVLKLFFAFGIAFEIPIAAILMIWAGITTADDLAKKTTLHHCWLLYLWHAINPHRILVSQSLLAVPMWILFEFGVFLGRFLEKDDDEEVNSP